MIFEVGAIGLAALRRTPAELKRIHRAPIGMKYAIAHEQLGDEEDERYARRGLERVVKAID